MSEKKPWKDLSDINIIFSFFIKLFRWVKIVSNVKNVMIVIIVFNATSVLTVRDVNNVVIVNIVREVIIVKIVRNVIIVKTVKIVNTASNVKTYLTSNLLLTINSIKLKKNITKLLKTLIEWDDWNIKDMYKETI